MPRLACSRPAHTHAPSGGVCSSILGADAVLAAHFAGVVILEGRLKSDLSTTAGSVSSHFTHHRSGSIFTWRRCENFALWANQ